MDMAGTAPPEEQGQGWEVVASAAAYDDGFSVFPPSRHEGLHPHPHPHPEPDRTPSSSPSPRDLFSVSSPRHVEVEKEEEEEEKEPAWSSWQPVSEAAKRAVWSGLELVQSKISLIRQPEGRGGAVWSVAAAAAVVGALLYVRRWRRREKELLRLLIQEKDQRINQLVNQIAQLNELLPMLTKLLSEGPNPSP